MFLDDLCVLDTGTCLTPPVPRCLCCPPHTSPAFSAHHCWLLLPPSERTPPARASHSCNMLGGSLVVFGGNDAAALFNDVWVCDPGTSPTLTCGECVCVSLMHCIMVCAATGAWNEPTVVGTPPTPRSTHSAAVYGSRMFVFGGATGAGEHLSDGLHVLEDSGGTGKLVWCVWLCPWRQRQDCVSSSVVVLPCGCMATRYRPAYSGAPPAARCGHSAVFVEDSMFVWGGNDNTRNFGDLHLLTVGREGTSFSACARELDVPTTHAARKCAVQARIR